MRMRLLVMVLLAGLLAACAPSASDGPRVTVEQLAQPISFYPRETGATWQYLPDGATLDEDPLFSRVEGPIVLNGEIVTAWRLVGRGIDEQDFRRFDPTGVYLLRTNKPGSSIDFDPPIRELPAQEELRVGARWGGETSALVRFPGAHRPEDREQTFDIDYSYTVVDERYTNVPAGQFRVFVINFQSRWVDEEGDVLEELSQTSWFAPHIGQVRTVGGYYLVDANFDLSGQSTANQ